jgi:hypothetical protein
MNKKTIQEVLIISSLCFFTTTSVSALTLKIKNENSAKANSHDNADTYLDRNIHIELWENKCDTKNQKKLFDGYVLYGYKFEIYTPENTNDACAWLNFPSTFHIGPKPLTGDKCYATRMTIDSYNKLSGLPDVNHVFGELVPIGC